MAQELQGSALQASWLRIQIEDKKKFSGNKNRQHLTFITTNAAQQYATLRI